jgi:hypothetical protein
MTLFFPPGFCGPCAEAQRETAAPWLLARLLRPEVRGKDCGLWSETAWGESLLPPPY